MEFLNGPIFDQFISPLSTWIGLATFFFSVYISLVVTFGRRWKFKNWKKDALSTKVERPAALIVDLVGKGALLDAQKYLKTLPNEPVIIEMGRPGNMGSKENMTADEVPKFMDEFKEKLTDLSNVGADRTFLFLSAPTPIVALVAAELANFGGIVMMHWNAQDGVYENWGPLRY